MLDIITIFYITCFEMQYIQYFCSIKVLNSSFLCSYTTYEYSELSKRFLKTNPERKFVLFLKPPQTSTKK
ncbi:MAG: hypothetical protein CMP67_06540 [Flavobacteriales bacterium]|nr:hypothetical protein [Flavobacteriales bacterium]